jgi:putative oxidoreductase
MPAGNVKRFLDGGYLAFKSVLPATTNRRISREDTMDPDAEIVPRRLVFPWLAKLYGAFSPYSYAFMRFSTGAVLFPHGVQKVFFARGPIEGASIAAHGLPFATTLAYLVVFTEFVAAGCLALGLFTRVAAVMIWIEMAVIITLWLWPNGYFWTSKGFEYPLLWLLLCTAIFFRGGGRYSLDRLIGKEI